MGINMKEFWQKNYKKIISYVIVAAAVLSVFVAGITAIRKVQNTKWQTYHVHGQYASYHQPLEVTNEDSFVYEFTCVGEEMVALLVEAQIYDYSIGGILYRIEDMDENVLTEGWLDIQEARQSGYEGVWLDVSDLGLEQGQQYRLRVVVGWSANVIYIYEDFKISVTQVFEYNYAALYTAIVIVLMVLALVWLYFMYKKGPSAKLYFITSLVIGLFVIFLMPPANRDDEYRHFLRAYMDVKDLEAIQMVPTGNAAGLIGDQEEGEFLLEVPYEINELRLMGYEDNYNGYEYKTEINHYLCIDKLLTILEEEPVESTHYVSLAGVAYKNNAAYWPQILSMKIAEFFGARDLILYYAARFGQFFVCIFMEVLAMKLAPRMKEIIWILAFIPNAFILKASCNTDGLMTAEILLTVAIIMWMKEKNIDVLSKKGLLGCLGYFLLTYNIVQTKFPYAVISVGVLAYLGKDNVAKAWNWIKSHKKAASAIAVAAAMAIIGTVVLFKDKLLNFIYAFLPQTHIEYILENPGEIAKLFSAKWVDICINLYSGMKGESLIPYTILVVVLLAMLKKELPMAKRVWFTILFGVMVMVIVLVGYTLSPADYGAIEEIGYRYLLPFLVVGALVLPSGNEKTERIAVKIMPLAIFVNLATTMITWIVGWSV